MPPEQICKLAITVCKLRRHDANLISTRICEFVLAAILPGGLSVFIQIPAPLRCHFARIIQYAFPWMFSFDALRRYGRLQIFPAHADTIIPFVQLGLHLLWECIGVHLKCHILFDFAAKLCAGHFKRIFSLIQTATRRFVFLHLNIFNSDCFSFGRFRQPKIQHTIFVNPLR